MTKTITRSFALALLAGVAGSAVAQQTFTFGVTNSFGAFGNVNNVKYLAFSPVGTQYTMGATATKVSGLLTSKTANTYPEDSVIRLSNSAFPGAFVSLRPITTQSSFVTAAVVPGVSGYFSSFGSLIGGIVPVGSTWSAEFYETFDDSIANRDAEWASLVFSTTSVVAPNGTVTVPSGSNFTDFTHDPDNTIVSLGTQSSAFVLGRTVKCVGSITQIDTAALSGQAWIRLSNSAYPFFQFDIIPFQANAFTLGTASVNATFTTGSTAGYKLTGLTIPSGSTWSAELFNNALVGGVLDNDGLIATQLSTPMVIDLYAGTADAVGTPPALEADLGALSSSTTVVTLPAIAASTVKWYKFIIPAINGAAGKYLDMYTGQSLAAPNTNQDTLLGLYNASGKLLGFDDDSGQGSGSVGYSALSFGDSANPRPPIAIGTLTPSQPFNGFDGLGLAAGSYYAVVGKFSMSFSDTLFNVTSTATALPADLQLTLNTNLGQAISGTVTLNDWTIDEAGQIVAWTLLDSSSTVVASGNTTLGVAGAYSLGALVPNGSYTLTMKGSHWLNSASAPVALTGSGTFNFSLINGDVNNDNFVGFDDFDILSASFNLSLGDGGYSVGADLNGDDFVGFDDFDILSANFNTSGD